MTAKPRTNITAGRITAVLKEKHHKDVFVPECKTGPTMLASHSRFDALVMTKSWAHPAVIGYEIKVSRQDFLHDTKWTDYLEYCNELYFVCPPGLISVNEVSDDVGLYWTTGSCTKVYQKKKAKYRNIQIPDSLWRYILMWRARIGKEIDPNGRTKQDDWRQWLEDRRIDRDFGLMVGRAIKQEIKKKIQDVDGENARLQNLINKYHDIKLLIENLGFDPEHFNDWEVQHRISVGKIDTQNVNRAIGDLERQLGYVKEFVRNLETEK